MDLNRSHMKSALSTFRASCNFDLQTVTSWSIFTEECYCLADVIGEEGLVTPSHLLDAVSLGNSSAHFYLIL